MFKRLFAEAADLLVDLINDLRPDLPDMTSVAILNPNIEASELTGKYIILDVLARDGDGHCYNVEIQVRRYGAWQEELTMANVEHEPVMKAMSRIRELSANEEACRLAFVRERALRDEVSLLNDAKREGENSKAEQIARNLIAMNLLTDSQIASASGLSEREVQALREVQKL